MKWSRSTVAAATTAAILLLPACESHNDLVPANDSGLAAADDTVVQEMAGVRMSIDGDAWHGDPSVPDLVTPIEVTIDNRSGKDLWIRFADFALLGAYDRYSVLPVFRFKTENGRIMLLEGYAPVTEPAFSYDTFFVDQEYLPAYPGFDTYPHALVLDDGYYARYAIDTEKLPVPIIEMQRWAVPEGVLPNDSHLEGFLFFEGLHPGEKKVTFLAQLQDVSTGDYFGAIQIPLEPEGPLQP